MLPFFQLTPRRRKPARDPRRAPIARRLFAIEALERRDLLAVVAPLDSDCSWPDDESDQPAETRAAAAASDAASAAAAPAMSALSATIVSSSQIALTWSAVAGANRFVIFRYDGVRYSELATVSAATTAYLDSSLTAGRFYQYAVRALNVAGQYTDAFVDVMLTKAAKPSAPANLTAESAGAGTVALGWSQATAVDHFDVFRYDGTRYSRIATVTAGTNAYTDTAPSRNALNQYAVRAVGADGQYADAFVDLFVAAAGDSTGAVPSFSDVPYFGGANDWNLNLINAPEAWAKGYTGQGVVVAVIDTGIDLSHPDLVSQIWVNQDEIAGDGIDNDRNGYVDDTQGWDFYSDDNRPQDENGHGTHVAGTIVAANNGVGATGVAYGAQVMALRALGSDGSGSLVDIITAVYYAVNNGAKVINLSLGGGGANAAMQQALKYAADHNVVVVAAAGNESAARPGWPASYAATLANVLSVGAYSQTQTRASFSNRVGTSGVEQVDAPGVSITSTVLGGGTGRMSGTSMATPHVAGLAALALSAVPGLTAAQLRSVILSGATFSIANSDSAGGINAVATLTAAFALLA